MGNAFVVFDKAGRYVESAGRGAVFATLLIGTGCSSSPRIVNLSESSCRSSFVTALTGYLAEREDAPERLAHDTVERLLAEDSPPGRFVVAGGSGRVYSFAMRGWQQVWTIALVNVVVPHGDFGVPSVNDVTPPDRNHESSRGDGAVTAANVKNRVLVGCRVAK